MCCPSLSNSSHAKQSCFMLFRLEVFPVNMWSTYRYFNQSWLPAIVPVVSCGTYRQSSTWRELIAVEQVLQSFAGKLAGHRVKWFTDNQNVVRIVQSGSRRQHLQDGAMSIFEVCLAHNIRLDVAWICWFLTTGPIFWAALLTMMTGSCVH